MPGRRAHDVGCHLPLTRSRITASPASCTSLGTPPHPRDRGGQTSRITRLGGGRDLRSLTRERRSRSPVRLTLSRHGEAPRTTRSDNTTCSIAAQRSSSLRVTSDGGRRVASRRARNGARRSSRWHRPMRHVRPLTGSVGAPTHIRPTARSDVAERSPWPRPRGIRRVATGARHACEQARSSWATRVERPRLRGRRRSQQTDRRAARRRFT